MKKLSKSSLPAVFAALLLCLSCFSNPGIASAATVLKIGIAAGISSGTLSGSSVRGTDASGADCSFSGGVTLSAAGDRVLIGGRTALLPVRFVSASPISYGRTAYEGDLLLIRASSGFTLINEIELEEYLRGILKVEANPAWPQESLKAQAILARTFALQNRGKHRSQGFDLCDDSHCQVYRGVNGYDPRTDAAVAATRGMILSYGGGPAHVFFHADSGGATTDASSVWGGREPYLVSVREPIAVASPYSTWTAVLTPDQVERAMAKIPVRLGTVRSISVEERDSSGRAKALRVVGDSGSARISGNAFRMALGSSLVKSTLFEIGGGSVVESPPRRRGIST
jgi:stage II sporulation protein D